MEEIWKDIEGYEGKYKVSNLGNVKSFVRDKNGKLLLGGRSGKYRNYYSVRLCGRCFKVHRLVAAAFIPNPNNLPLVNHKDENGLNNCVENLEWCDNKYNTNYGTLPVRRSQKNKELGLFVGENNPMYGKRGKLNPAHREVAMYSLSGQFIKCFDCVTFATRETGVNINDILSCCNKKLKRAGGYMWRFLEDDAPAPKIEPYKHPGERAVLQYSKDGHFLQKYDSIKVASEITGISRMTIGLCCCGKIRTSGGYIWRHANDVNMENVDLLDFEAVKKTIKWTRESCYQEAKKYFSRSQFQKGCSGAYIASRKNGWLDDYKWMQRRYKSGKSNDKSQLELNFG